MIKKTDLAVGHYEMGNVKEALKIAKDFKIGLTKEEHKQIVAGYECMVHDGFYKQIGKDPEKEIAKGVTVFLNKIYVPYVKRVQKSGCKIMRVKEKGTVYHKQMVTLDTYPQPNCNLPVSKTVFNDEYMDFEVERDWLEIILKAWDWGTVEQYLIEYTWDDAEKIFKAYQEYKNSLAVWHEWCSNCCAEVKLPPQFKKHICPNCKEEILPCAQCEEQNCSNCPLI